MKRKKKETEDDGKIKKILKAAGKTSAIMTMGLFLNGVNPQIASPFDINDLTMEELMEMAADMMSTGERNDWMDWYENGMKDNREDNLEEIAKILADKLVSS